MRKRTGSAFRLHAYSGITKYGKGYVCWRNRALVSGFEFVTQQADWRVTRGSTLAFVHPVQPCASRSASFSRLPRCPDKGCVEKT